MKWRDAVTSIALLAALACLPGCGRWGEFLTDTFSYDTDPNKPLGNSENFRRVQGTDTATGTLLPEPGNIWPTQLESAPTLQDLERETSQVAPAAPPPVPPPPGEPFVPHPQPRPGSSTPPGGDQSQAPATPPPANPGGPAVTPPNAPRPQGPIQTPQGPVTPTGPNTGVGPGGQQEIVVPNGNGTSTVIKPDGTITTVPTPR